MSEPTPNKQWFALQQRSENENVPNGAINVGTLTYASRSDVDSLKSSMIGLVNITPCGRNIEDALAKAGAMNDWGGQSHPTFDMDAVDFIEVEFADDDEREKSRGLFAAAYETGDKFGIRVADIHQLEKMAEKGIVFMAEVSSVTERDMWPGEPGDDDNEEDEAGLAP